MLMVHMSDDIKGETNSIIEELPEKIDADLSNR
jgi:hypothetical protein